MEERLLAQTLQRQREAEAAAKVPGGAQGAAAAAENVRMGRPFWKLGPGAPLPRPRPTPPPMRVLSTSVMGSGGRAPPMTVTGTHTVGEEERRRLDEVQSRRFFHRVRGSGRVDVNIKSKGQMSTTQGAPFKKVPWHRHQQMEATSQGPPAAKAMSGGGEE